MPSTTTLPATIGSQPRHINTAIYSLLFADDQWFQHVSHNNNNKLCCSILFDIPPVSTLVGKSDPWPQIAFNFQLDIPDLVFSPLRHGFHFFVEHRPRVYHVQHYLIPLPGAPPLFPLYTIIRLHDPRDFVGQRTPGPSYVGLLIIVVRV